MNNENNNILLNIQRYIFWIDQNIENHDNQKYLKHLKDEFPLYETKTFKSIKSVGSHLKKEKKNMMLN